MWRKALALFIIFLAISPLIALIAAPAPALAYTTSDIDRAIDRGVDWVIRSIAFFDNYGVIRDHPSIPIVLEYNGQRFMVGGFLDPGDKCYKVELVGVTSTSIKTRYYFNLDNDNDYDVIIYAELRNIDYYTDQIYLYVEKCDLSGVKLYLGSTSPKINGVTIYQGYSATVDAYSWEDWYFSCRYVARHSTRIAAWLLEDAGYSWYATYLHNFMDAHGFTYDVYAPVFGRSNNYPDDFWDYPETWLGNGYDSLPWVTTTPNLYPYKSRIYIFAAMGQYSTAINGWKQFPLFKLLKALHLLNKYGTARAAEAEQLILQALQEGQYDGYGLKAAMYGAYKYKGYPVYLNAVLLAACVRYYQVTGDRYVGSYDILQIADRLAGILLALQWDYQHETPWGTVSFACFRGGWPACYRIGSLIAAPSAWGIIDFMTETWDDVAEYLALTGVPVDYKALIPMPSEFPFAIVNSESTILATKALMLYKQLGRTPSTLTVYIGPSGRFYSSGGGGGTSGYYGVQDGRTSPEGSWVEAYALASGLWGWTGSAWRYQYAKFAVDAASAGYYNVTISAIAMYKLYVGGESGYGEGSAKADLIIKVFDSYGNLIKQVTIPIDQAGSNEYKTGYVGKVVNFKVYLPSSGTYYIEVGIQTQAEASIGNALADLYGYEAGPKDNVALIVDSVKLAPSA